MWLWESELRELGFKRKSERYWQCERHFDLPDHAHLSVFSWGEQSIPAGRSGPVRFLVELTEFHVTFRLGLEHVHFYYHERLDNEWVPAGHTSGAEIRRLDHDPAPLRQAADVIAAALATALGGAYRPRPGRRRPSPPPTS
jgi:hypothetical protein